MVCGMGDVNQELKVLLNVHKGVVQYLIRRIKKSLGGGGGGRGKIRIQNTLKLFSFYTS